MGRSRRVWPRLVRLLTTEARPWYSQNTKRAIRPIPNRASPATPLSCKKNVNGGTCCLGCKRSRVQIPAARPNVSNVYSLQCSRNRQSGVQPESKMYATADDSHSLQAGFMGMWQSRRPLSEWPTIRATWEPLRQDSSKSVVYVPVYTESIARRIAGLSRTQCAQLNRRHLMH
jgi:hypothetical protein